MKHLTFIVFTLITNLSWAQPAVTAINITEVANMPVSISNNAVVEGWANDTGYVYSFAGIDSTKIWSGISLKSFRYNTVTNVWDPIPPLPDTMGKIAAAASYVDSMIYIIGGYHVLSNGNEISSNKVHRYNPKTNSYLTDGMNIPVAIDDHVQAVWNDSLIYVITGWSNTTNVPNVQIYDPTNNSWLAGTSTPNTNIYKAFGASGVIIGDTIYYHGGASTGGSFPAQSTLRIGYINPTNPTQITWTSQTTPYKTYRSTCTIGFSYPHWLGGAEITYNFDGIAYNGSGGVPTKTKNLVWNGVTFDSVLTYGGSLPMDLRGIASFDESLKYIAGGMLNGQQVSNKTYKINVATTTNIKENKKTLFNIYPNPSNRLVHLKFKTNEQKTVIITDMMGNMIYTTTISSAILTIDTSTYTSGVYLITVSTKSETNNQKIIVQ